MKKSNHPELNMLQIKADIHLAGMAISDSKGQEAHYAKYLKGLAAYHIQQATEKLVKIQIYSSNVKIDNSKIYKHSIGDLISYSEDLGLKIMIPSYIRKQEELITSWEAEGRYDTHVVVRIDTLQSCLKVVEEWYSSLLPKT